MVKYKDGTILKVGDVFASSKRGLENLRWLIMGITSTDIYWKCLIDDHMGSTLIPPNSVVTWSLVQRADGSKEIKRSGFSKFVRRIEGKEE